MAGKYLYAFLLLAALNARAQDAGKPVLIKQDNKAQLQVNGKPFIILGGELGNSSASSNAYMQQIWPKLAAMNLNTVLAPVYWELLEPEEGKFDFTLVDSLVINARKYNIKVVPLWFGTWKNSMSCYVPAWVKKAPHRFMRTLDDKGRSMEILSAFHPAILEADKKAFGALMNHIKKIDSKQQTVIMVQVENEVGMLTLPRERITAADSLYRSHVPAVLTNYLQKNGQLLMPELKALWQQHGAKTNGTWEELFGISLATEEIFQAWHYAAFVNEVAAAGKRMYDIPMYVNAALFKPTQKPGDYPSAGPLPQVMDIWKAAAPSVDVLAPDFYNPDTKYWCDLYTRGDNPLFIPEIRLDSSCAAKVFYVLGHHKAIGFSPFSIENATPQQASALGKSYELLQQLMPLLSISDNREGVLFHKPDIQQQLKMGDYIITAKHDCTLGWSKSAPEAVWPATGALIVQIAKDEFLVAGTGVVCTFASASNGQVVNIESVDEGRFLNGQWKPGRRLNGDEDHQGRHLRIPEVQWDIQRIKLYNSPVRN